MTKVSIIVPVYNVETYIDRCLRSIEEQTLKDIEIIVVDDCTPDKSMTIVERFAKEDSRFKIIKHEYNKGLMWARRTGYMAAIGDYITFCDSDDYLPNNAVELLYKEAIKTEADIVSGNLQYFFTNGKTEKWTNELHYGNDKESALKSLLLGELMHCLCSKLFKRELLQDYHYQTFEHFTNGEDGCLFYQVIDNMHKIVQIDEIVYNYMQNISSSSQVMYNSQAIKCICMGNRIRHEVSSKVSEMDKELHRRITSVLYNLYSQGYAYSSELDKHIKEQGLTEYATVRGRYFSNKEKIKLWSKRHILGLIIFVKSKVSRR